MKLFLLLVVVWNVLGLGLANSQQSLLKEYVADCDIPEAQIQRITIQQITLYDSILIKEIKKLMNEEERKFDLFRQGYGFVQVIPDYDLKEGILRSYYINVNYVGLKTSDQNPEYYLSYPDYYSFIDNRLVFIYLQMTDGMICKRFTNKSMKKVRKIQNKYLEDTKKMKAYDMKGNHVFTDPNFRIDHHKSWHSGKYIYIYLDRPYEVHSDSLGEQ